MKTQTGLVSELHPLKINVAFNILLKQRYGIIKNLVARSIHQSICFLVLEFERGQEIHRAIEKQKEETRLKILREGLMPPTF